MIKSIIAQLEATSAVTDITSNIYAQAAGRTAPERGPYIVVHQITGGRINTLGGGGTTSLSTIQVDCIATTYAGARALASACEASLSGFRDVASTPKIHMVHLDDETDDDFSPTDSGASPIYRIVQDYHVSWDTGA